jgi:hypothetical protein
MKEEKAAAAKVAKEEKAAAAKVAKEEKAAAAKVAKEEKLKRAEERQAAGGDGKESVSSKASEDPAEKAAAAEAAASLKAEKAEASRVAKQEKAAEKAKRAEQKALAKAQKKDAKTSSSPSKKKGGSRSGSKGRTMAGDPTVRDHLEAGTLDMTQWSEGTAGAIVLKVTSELDLSWTGGNEVDGVRSIPMAKVKVVKGKASAPENFGDDDSAVVAGTCLTVKLRGAEGALGLQCESEPAAIALVALLSAIKAKAEDELLAARRG